jgi:hypothetical protein
MQLFLFKIEPIYFLISGPPTNFYPSFNVANPTGKNVSRNVLLTPPKPGHAPHPATAHHPYHHHPVAFAAAAAAAVAAAAQVAQAAAKHNQNSKNPVMSGMIRDRLEITELSDAEDHQSSSSGGPQVALPPNPPMIPSPDYRRPMTPSSDHEGKSRGSSHTSGSHHGKILDIPSGLY